MTKLEWTPPRAWQWTLWERERHPHAGWQLVLSYTAEFVSAVKGTLTRLQPDMEFVVCGPGGLGASRGSLEPFWRDLVRLDELERYR